MGFLSPACLPLPWTDEEKEHLRILWAEGHPQTEIGRRLGGKSKTAVKNQVDRMGLARRASAVGPRLSDEERAARQRPERNDALAQLMRQATLPLPQPMPFAAPKTCQWPEWRDDERPGLTPRFCGVRAQPGRPYCACHWQRAHTPRVWVP